MSNYPLADHYMSFTIGENHSFLENCIEHKYKPFSHRIKKLYLKNNKNKNFYMHKFNSLIKTFRRQLKDTVMLHL